MNNLIENRKIVFEMFYAHRRSLQNENAGYAFLLICKSFNGQDYYHIKMVQENFPLGQNLAKWDFIIYDRNKRIIENKIGRGSVRNRAE